MVCAGCKNLDTKKKANGKVSGAKYYCKKLKCYIPASNEICSKFSKSYSRDIDTYNKLYEEGIKFDDDNHSFSFYLICTIVVIVFIVIMNIIYK